MIKEMEGKMALKRGGDRSAHKLADFVIKVDLGPG